MAVMPQKITTQASRMNISVPKALKEQMERVNANWSKIAQDAFRAELQRLEDSDKLARELTSLRVALGLGAHWQP
jgi:post-segregation antitoxin (ccd killing protein)